jgi:hypothetical protein
MSTNAISRLPSTFGDGKPGPGAVDNVGTHPGVVSTTGGSAGGKRDGTGNLAAGQPSSKMARLLGATRSSTCAALPGPATSCGVRTAQTSVTAVGPVGLPEVKPGNFSIVLIPDVQYITSDNPAVLKSMMKWITDHARSHRIAFVGSLGDMTSSNQPGEWQLVSEAFEDLETISPNGRAGPGAPAVQPLVGNHDLGANGSTDVRDATLFNAYFGPRRYEQRGWYGGHYDEGNENSYVTFETEGMKLLILGLEFGPRDEVLAWAEGILAAHPEHRVMINTHAYMYHDNTRLGPEDGHNPDDYFEQDLETTHNDGEAIYDKIVSRFPNVFMVVSGHVGYGKKGAEGLALQSSRLETGNPLYEMLTDFQNQPYQDADGKHYERGGGGCIRMVVFDRAKDLLRVRTINPLDNTISGGPAHSLDLPYDMP